jgi:rSAM/selenodomain-associated transferase 1
MTNPAVAVMSRIPSAEGKSRLSDVLTPDQREALQWAFLLDTLDTVRLLPEYKCYLAATPADEINKLAEVTGTGVEVIPQPGGSLGQRMQNIASQLFSRGHSPVVLIGTDAPALPPSILIETLHLLNHSDLVFGPAFDGGYYLIGMRNQVDAVFAGIDWGGETVLRKTISICKRNNLRYSLLECLTDVDRPDDLLAAAEQCQEQMEMMPFPAGASRFLKLIERDKLS